MTTITVMIIDTYGNNVVTTIPITTLTEIIDPEAAKKRYNGLRQLNKDIKELMKKSKRSYKRKQIKNGLKQD